MLHRAALVWLAVHVVGLLTFGFVGYGMLLIAFWMKAWGM